MAEDLKLFGKVGLDVSTLKSNIDNMNSLIEKGNKNVGSLGETFEEVSKKMKNSFKDIPITELNNIFTSMATLQKKYNVKQVNSMATNTANIVQIEKNGLMLRAAANREANNRLILEAETVKKKNVIMETESNAKILNSKAMTEAKVRTEEEKTKNLQIKNVQETSTLRKKETEERIAELKEQINYLKLMQLQEQNANKNLSYSPFKNRFNSLADYLIASSGMYSAISAFKNVLEVNKQFEVQQISLQRVLGGTTEQMEELKTVTFNVARETGNLINDVQTIQNLWIRTGVQDTKAIESLSKVTSMGLNVAEFDNAADSVSYLNAAINQMVDGDWTKAEAILDSWAKTSDYTSVKTTTDLAEVVARSGSYAKQLNMTYNDLNGMTAIIAERMAKSGEEIGTAFKSIFARIQDETYYKEIEKWGVKVTETGAFGYETFRDFTDIMDDLNEKFKVLSEAEYDTAIAEITQALGGTRQGNYVANLIEGWDSFDEKVKISTESAGYVAEQNEKIMESFDKQIKELQAALAELSVSLGEAGVMGFLEGLVSGATWAVDAFNNMEAPLRNTVLATSELLIGFGLLGAVKSKVFGDHIIKNMLDSIIALKNGTLDMKTAETLLLEAVNAKKITSSEAILITQQLTTGKKVETLSTNAQTVAEEIQTGATIKLVTAKTLLMGVTKALVVLIPMIIVGINTWKNSQEALRREQIESLKNQKDEIKTSDDLIAKYELLSQKTEKTAEDKAELKSISEQLLEIFPQSAALIDTETSAYSRQLDVLKNLNAEKKQDALDNAELYKIQNQSSYDDSVIKRNEYLDAYNKRKAQLDEYMLDGNINPNWSETEAGQLSKLKGKIDELDSSIKEYRNNLKVITTLENEIDPSDEYLYRKARQEAWEYLNKPITPTQEGEEEEDYSGLEPLEEGKYKAFEIDYRYFENSIKALEYELNLLDREQSFLDNIEDKSKVYDIYSRQMQAHSNVITELTKHNANYKDMLVDVDRKLSSLSPASENYEDELEALKDAHDELTDKIKETVLQIKDEQLAMEDIKKSMESLVIDNLTSGLNAQKDVAAKRLQKQQDKEILALQKQIYSNKTQEDYNEFVNNKIDKLKEELELLNEQIDAQEKINRLQDIRDEIDKVKADTRYAYIDGTGKEVYTYDRGKVKDLEAEYQEELVNQQNEAEKQKIQDKIDALEEEKAIADDSYAEAVKALEENHKEQLESFEAYWDKKLKAEEIKQEALALIQKVGYQNAIITSQQFNKDMLALLDGQAIDMYNKGKLITDSLFNGLFADLSAYIAQYLAQLSTITDSDMKNSQTGSVIGGIIGSGAGGALGGAGVAIGGAVGAVAGDVANIIKDVISSGSSSSTKSNQQKYLENLSKTGDYGQKEWAKSQLSQGKYALGGVNDFTGYAQLDGTPNMVETIFNATDGRKLYDLVHNTGNLSTLIANSVIDDVRELVIKSPSINTGFTALSSEGKNVNNSKSIVIHIDNVNADNIDDFMNSMSPYINAR